MQWGINPGFHACTRPTDYTPALRYMNYSSQTTREEAETEYTAQRKTLRYKCLGSSHINQVLISKPGENLWLQAWLNCVTTLSDQSVGDKNNDGTKRPTGGLTCSQRSVPLMFLWSCVFQNHRRYQKPSSQEQASEVSGSGLEGTSLVLSRHHVVKGQQLSSLSFAYSGKCTGRHTGNGYLAGKYLSWLFAP